MRSRRAPGHIASGRSNWQKHDNSSALGCQPPLAGTTDFDHCRAVCRSRAPVIRLSRSYRKLYGGWGGGGDRFWTEGGDLAPTRWAPSYHTVSDFVEGFDEMMQTDDAGEAMGAG